MNVESLADLQAAADAAEVNESEFGDSTLEEESQDLDLADDQEIDGGEDGDSQVADSQQVDDPDWTKPDKKQVPLSALMDVKHRLKSQLNEERDKSSAIIESLQARIADLETLKSAPRQEEVIDPPTLESCGYDENEFRRKNAEYVSALVDKKLSNFGKKNDLNKAQEEISRIHNEQVDEHYDRASKLITDGVVTEENFRNAENIVRNRLSHVVPGVGGDDVYKSIVVSIGKGSEKVGYHLGVNPAALTELENILRRDASGLQAAVYLGKMAAKFESAQINKLSNAPKPDRPLTGSQPVTDSLAASFKKAEKKGDISAMIAARKAAKAKGIDITKW